MFHLKDVSGGREGKIEKLFTSIELVIVDIEFLREGRRKTSW